MVQGLYQCTRNLTNQIGRVDYDYDKINAEAFHSDSGPSKPHSAVVESPSSSFSDEAHTSLCMAKTFDDIAKLLDRQQEQIARQHQTIDDLHAMMKALMEKSGKK